MCDLEFMEYHYFDFLAMLLIWLFKLSVYVTFLNHGFVLAMLSELIEYHYFF